jgi:hypothetical protein
MRHGKTERQDGKSNRKQNGTVCVCTYSVTESTFSHFNFDTIGGILIHWIYAPQHFVKQIIIKYQQSRKTINQNALFLKTKREDFTPNSTLEELFYLSVGLSPVGLQLTPRNL